MKIRKLVLLAADVLLLAVCIVQGIVAARDTARDFTLADAPDEISITTAGGTVHLSFDGENWTAGDKKYPVTAQYVTSMVEALQKIHTVDAVARLANDAAAEKYELDDAHKTSVVAKKNGTVVRTIDLGKSASAYSQGYITVDGGDTVYLASGGLNGTFKKSLEDIRSKVVYSVDPPSISRVELAPEGKSSWAVSRSGAGESASFSAEGFSSGIDAQKTSSWFDSFASLNASRWYDEEFRPEGGHIVRASVTAGADTITLDVFEVPATDENSQPVFYGICSASPYPFEIPSYAVQKYQKNPEDLAPDAAE